MVFNPESVMLKSERQHLVVVLETGPNSAPCSATQLCDPGHDFILPF